MSRICPMSNVKLYYFWSCRFDVSLVFLLPVSVKLPFSFIGGEGGARICSIIAGPETVTGVSFLLVLLICCYSS